MYEDSLTIRRPFGVSVFGSGLIRVIPDVAMIRVAVSAINEKPARAFAEARQRVQAATGFLSKLDGLEFGASKVRLAAEHRFSGGESRFVGYRARVSINVQLQHLDSLEDVTIGLVDAGANEIEFIQFQTSQLKKLRAEARSMAMSAAKEKALLYANAAGIRLGKVIHIEDVNPEELSERPTGHHPQPPTPEFDDESGAQAFDPAAISIHAAVLVAYAIE